MGGRVGGVRVDVNGEVKLGSGGVGLGGGVRQGGWEQRSEACVKIHKKKIGGGGGGFGWKGGCEWRSEAFVKIQNSKVNKVNII